MFGVWPRGLRDVPAAPTGELSGLAEVAAIRFAKAREKAEVRHGAP
jgi:hypothetical protein